MKLSADALLVRATTALDIDLVALIARCAVFAHPDVVAAITPGNAGAVWFPGYRRSRPHQREPKRGAFQGEMLDDNTKANLAIKEAIFADAHAGCSGFAACHIWPGTCYSAACHTALANLVLLPASIAGLTNHNPAVASVLQSRSYEIYGWLPPDVAPLPAIPNMAWHPFITPSAQVLRRVARRAGFTPP